MSGSSSCWAKLSPNKASSQTVTLQELETWDKRRREKAAKIAARRRVERAAASTKRLPAGYGRNGTLPAYVEAHLVSLQASPLGKSARPNATVRSSPSRRRQMRQTGSASDTTVIGTGRQTSPHSSSSSPEKRRRRVKGAPVSTAAAMTNTSARPIKGWGQLGSAKIKQGGQPYVDATTTDSRRCSTDMHKRDHEGSAPLAFYVQSRADPNSRVAATTSSVAIRPASAPSAPRRRSKLTSTGGSDRKGNGSPVTSPLDAKEAELLEKLASLTCRRPDGEYPTVAALRTAVAIDAIQAQLRDCRNRVVGGNKEEAGLLHRGISATAVTGVHRYVSDDAADATLRVVPRRRKEIEPWDNRSPFVPEKVSAAGAARGRADRPVSAPALRMLGSNDPVFGNTDAYRNCWRRRRSARSHSPHRPDKTATNRDHQEEQAPSGHCYSQTRTQRHGYEEGCTEASNTTTIAAAVRKVEACSRRLTVGVLIELSHLRNPPEPVRAVQAALACLLGWQQQWKPSRDPVPRVPRSLFSNAYLLRGILSSVCPRRISDRRLSMLEKKLGLHEAAPARVGGANAAAAVLLEWLLAVVACARAET